MDNIKMHLDIFVLNKLQQVNLLCILSEHFIHQGLLVFFNQNCIMWNF